MVKSVIYLLFSYQTGYIMWHYMTLYTLSDSWITYNIHCIFIIFSDIWFVNWSLANLINNFVTPSFQWFSLIWVRIMVFHATFYNISVISWRSVLLVKETVVLLWKPQTCHKTLSQNIVSSTSHHEWDSNSELYSGDSFRHWLHRKWPY